MQIKGDKFLVLLQVIKLENFIKSGSSDLNKLPEGKIYPSIACQQWFDAHQNTLKFTARKSRYVLPQITRILRKPDVDFRKIIFVRMMTDLDHIFIVII